MDFRYPVYKPSLNGNEKKYVNECLESSWISSKGKFIAEFEHAFANFICAKHAGAASNGTVALHLALVILGVGPSDEVIVPTLTYVASVNAIAYTGATAVFVDSLPDTWQMNPAEIEKKITPKTKAIMAVHLYGHPCDMEALQRICKKHNLFLIEDCAEAIGSLYKGRHVGTFGDVSTFSFFGNKTITTGEGGMIICKDKGLFDKAVHYKGQGLVKNKEYWHDVVGYNYRMTNICAAIGLAQLEQANTFIKRKIEIANLYKELLSEVPVCFHEEDKDVTHSYWICSILVATPVQRDLMRKHLASFGVETRPLFYPVHTMPMYLDKQAYPIAEDLGSRGINLPSYPGLTNTDITVIVDKIKAFLN